MKLPPLRTNSGKGIILIVDDNTVLRKGLSEMLESEDFCVIAAENGKAALQEMQEVTPDLILSDISMPEMDGFTFFHIVRSHADWIRIPFLFLTAREERGNILTSKNLGAEDYLVKPVSQQELLTAVRSRLSRSRQLHVAQLQQAYLASLSALANAIDLRDRYTHGHVERVTAYSLALARKLGWQSWRQEQLRFGAILHDIGKIHIREQTLFKPPPLDEEEWEEIRQHPVNGAEMIRNIPYLAPAIPVVRHHHERWDGQGYPDGLAGEAIPEGARILAVADAFDVITTDHSYSPKRSLQEAYQEIVRCGGSHFDPKVITAFKKAWKEGQFTLVDRAVSQ